MKLVEARARQAQSQLHAAYLKSPPMLPLPSPSYWSPAFGDRDVEGLMQSSKERRLAEIQDLVKRNLSRDFVAKSAPFALNQGDGSREWHCQEPAGDRGSVGGGDGGGAEGPGGSPGVQGGGFQSRRGRPQRRRRRSPPPRPPPPPPPPPLQRPGLQVKKEAEEEYEAKILAGEPFPGP